MFVHASRGYQCLNDKFQTRCYEPAED